jgi:hypothetical protein
MLKQIQDNKQVITDVTAKKAPNQVTPPTE